MADAILPAGTYFIGDPCYIVSDDKVWDHILSETDYFANPYEIDDVIMLCACSTSYGDGVYVGSDGKNYPVDSGCIGAFNVDCEGIELSEDALKMGSVYTFESEFEVSTDPRGIIQIGHISIDTGSDDLPDYVDYDLDFDDEGEE